MIISFRRHFAAAAAMPFDFIDVLHTLTMPRRHYDFA